MGDWPASALNGLPDVISAGSLLSGTGPVALLTGNFNTVATAWPAANVAISVPFVIEAPAVAYQMIWENGATITSSFDVGIYDVAGNRLVSTGSVAQSGASAIQVADITDTALNPGIYHMAMACGATATGLVRSTALPARMGRVCGAQEMSVTSGVLPNPASFAAMTRAFIPLLSIGLRPVM